MTFRQIDLQPTEAELALQAAYRRIDELMEAGDPFLLTLSMRNGETFADLGYIRRDDQRLYGGDYHTHVLLDAPLSQIDKIEIEELP